MNTFKKTILISTFCSISMTSSADSITSVASAGSVASTASATSIYFPEALIGSVGSVYYSGMAVALSGEVLVATISSMASEGREWVITSAQFVGDKVSLTVQTSGKIIQSGVETSKEVTSFTFEVSASAFTASTSVAEEVIELMFNGVKTAVKAVPIIAGSAGVLLGCTLTLVSAPGVIIGVILTEAGRELHASS